MESSTLTILVWKKWVPYILASSLGFFILFLRLNQGWQPAAILLPTSREAKLPHGSTAKGAAREPSAELSPEPGVLEGLSPVSSIWAPPWSSLEQRASPPSNIEFYAQLISMEERETLPSETEMPPQSSIETGTSAEGMALPPQTVHWSRRPSLQSNPQPSATGVIPPRYKKDLSSPQIQSNQWRQVPSPAENNSQANAIPVKSVTAGGNTEPPSPSLQGKSPSPAEKSMERRCDIFDGRWVYDPKNYPLYRDHSCPFLSEQVSCQKNGRPDSNYEHWRWKPNGCKLPRFSGKKMLERLRGKRVVIVGDSLNRNQWESLVCLLYSAPRRRRAYVRRAIDYSIFKSLDYRCTVEFFWCPFLIKLDEKDGKKMLKLDTLAASSWNWRGADVMVFNTGHWWNHHGRLRTWNYFEYNGEPVEMKEVKAYEVALKTWAHWVDEWVDPTKTTVFFRSISPQHKGRNLHWCYNQTHPITSEIYKRTFPMSMMSTVERTIQYMRTPVKLLNITRLSEYRRDAHTSVYTTRKGELLTGDQQEQPKMFADCSHWCLPGLPDTWNILLYASIVGLPATHV